MTQVRVISDTYIEALKLQIRDAASDPNQLGVCLELLGESMAKELVRQVFLRSRAVTTPMGHSVRGRGFAIPMCVIMSKKEKDATRFAAGVNRILEGSQRGYVAFGGRRGQEVKELGSVGIYLPPVKQEEVDTVVVAKAAIAGGCTVVEMASVAVKKFAPNRVVFLSGFYTEAGVAEIKRAFPKGLFIVAGKPDSLDANRMLIPGIGQLNARVQGRSPRVDVAKAGRRRPTRHQAS